MSRWRHELTPDEFARAQAVAKARNDHWQGDPENDYEKHLVGAVGEVAASVWATRRMLEPVDPAFADSARQGEADLFLGPTQTAIDVKTACHGDPYTFPSKQIDGLDKKADLVLWAQADIVRPKVGWTEPTGATVTLLGYSKAVEVEEAPEAGKLRRVDASSVHPLEDLLAMIRRRQLLEEAFRLERLGVRFRDGGEGAGMLDLADPLPEEPEALSCSQFIRYVVDRTFGTDFWKVLVREDFQAVAHLGGARVMANKLDEASDPEPGDLRFFSNVEDADWHVMMHVDGTTLIGACQPELGNEILKVPMGHFAAMTDQGARRMRLPPVDDVDDWCSLEDLATPRGPSGHI